MSPMVIDLGSYGFKGISSGERFKGFPEHPLSLFVGDDRVVLITKVKELPKGLESHERPDSWRLHYRAIVISLVSGTVTSEADLGGAGADSDADVLSDGTIVLYHPGFLEFWKLRSDGSLAKEKTVGVDVHEIDQAAAEMHQAFGGGFSPSFSHDSVYLIVRAYRSKLSKVWRITSTSVKPIDVHLLPLSIDQAVESDIAIFGKAAEGVKCDIYLIPFGLRRPTSKIYTNDCKNVGKPTFIGPDEIVFGGEHPEFTTASGDVISHPEMKNAGTITADWNGSAYMASRYGMSGGNDFFDIGAHLSKVFITVFDKQWHERCHLVMRMRGADLSGPYLSPKGDRIIAYDDGRFYAWDVNELASGPKGKTHGGQ